MDLFSSIAEYDVRAEKFCSRLPALMGPDWAELLKGFDLRPITDHLIKEADARVNKIYPNSQSIFRCFKECPLEKTKVVFIGQDPYYQDNTADGLAFSCGRTNKEQPSLRLIYNEIARTVYPGSLYQRHTDLVHWANQGVVLMNSALTVQAYRPDSHTELWAPFVRHALSRISEAIPDIIFVFVGGRAKTYMGAVKGAGITKIGVIHPAAAAHRGGQWDCDDVFNRINQQLTTLGKPSISW